MLAAGAGLSVILAQSAAAFTVVKLLGAAYLAYLGLRLILARAGPDAGAALAAEAPSRRRSASPYVQRVLTGLLNPKSALFFLTFLPQFLGPAGFAGQLAILATLTVAIAAVWLLAIIAHAGRAHSPRRAPAGPGGLPAPHGHRVRRHRDAPRGHVALTSRPGAGALSLDPPILAANPR